MNESIDLLSFPLHYAVVDAARMGAHLQTLLAMPNTAMRSLYRGEAEQTLKFVAPYLLRCSAESPARSFLLGQGWGKSWGIFVEAEVPFDEMLKHLRRFLKVQFENGKHYYFRFYDPRVLTMFLPTCSPEQLAELFGPVASYIAESAQPEMARRFHLGADKLLEDQLKLAATDSSRSREPVNKVLPKTTAEYDENTIV